MRGISIPWADELMPRSIKVLSTVMTSIGKKRLENPANINLTSDARKMDSLSSGMYQDDMLFNIGSIAVLYMDIHYFYKVIENDLSSMHSDYVRVSVKDLVEQLCLAQRVQSLQQGCCCPD